MMERRVSSRALRRSIMPNEGEGGREGEREGGREGGRVSRESR